MGTEDAPGDVFPVTVYSYCKKNFFQAKMTLRFFNSAPVFNNQHNKVLKIDCSRNKDICLLAGKIISSQLLFQTILLGMQALKHSSNNKIMIIKNLTSRWIYAMICCWGIVKVSHESWNTKIQPALGYFSLEKNINAFSKRNTKCPEPFQLSCEMLWVSVHECCCLMCFNLLFFLKKK